MLKKIIGVFSIGVLILGAGCASKNTLSEIGKNTEGEADGEKLLYRTSEFRPDWTMHEPDFEGTDLFFVGISGSNATEQLSRNDATSNAAKRVVTYLGTLVKDKFEKMNTSAGLASDVINPSEVRNAYQKQVSADVAKYLKTSKWYSEKWQKPTGVGWKTFVLAKIPKSSLANSFENTMDSQIKQAQQKQKLINDEVAKQQLSKSIDMMKKFKEAGISE